MKKINFLMLLASVFLLFSCRTELEPNEKTQEKDQGRSKIINLSNLQSQIGKENLSKEFKIPVTNNSSKTESTDFIIDEAKIIELENNPSDINYSMVVYPKIPKEENVFYNLIIRKINGNISKIVYKYTPNINWFNDYNNKVYREYNGKIDLIYKEGDFPSETSSKATHCFAQYIEMPCEFGYYHDDAHCEGDGSYFIKVMVCEDMGGGSTISYGGSSGSSGNGGSNGTIVTPLSLDTPMPYGNEYNNAYQNFKFDMHFAPNEKQWLSTHTNASVNLFWYVYNMGNTDEAFAVAKKYIQFAIAGQNAGFNNLSFSWVMNFIADNPDTTWQQFQNWFIDPNGNSNIMFETYTSSNNILTFNTMSDFKNFLANDLSNSSYDNNIIFDNGQEKITRLRVNRMGIYNTGINIEVKLKKSNNSWIFDSVSSEEYIGVGFVYEWAQSNHTSNTSNNILTLEVFGYEKIGVSIASIDIKYKNYAKVLIKINQSTGQIISATFIDLPN